MELPYFYLFLLYNQYNYQLYHYNSNNYKHKINIKQYLYHIYLHYTHNF